MESVKGYRPGEVVIKEGTKGTSAYIILSGAVEVLKWSGQKEVAVATLGEGQVFGEMGLIEDRPRSATVRALTELRVRNIDRDHFNELLRTKPSVLIPIMKSLFERLRQVSDMLAERVQDAPRLKGTAKIYSVLVEGQTQEAIKSLGNESLRIAKFPFLIGRSSQNPDADVFDSNDLLIPEEKPYVVSRNHMAVINEDGCLWVMDRGSAFGTIVNGKEIGGQSGVNRAPLDKVLNQVIMGPATSRYIFLLKPEAL